MDLITIDSMLCLFPLDVETRREFQIWYLVIRKEELSLGWGRARSRASKHTF